MKSISFRYLCFHWEKEGEFMKALKINFIILSILLAGSFALGGQDRGGGKGIVCRDNRNKVNNVELLDLWEAKHLRGKTIISSSGNMNTDLNLALDRAKYIFSEKDKRVYNSLEFASKNLMNCMYKNKPCTFRNVVRVTGVDLPISDDTLEGNLSLPQGCKVEQVIGFEHSNSPVWTLNMDLIEKMDSINVVSLSLHEAVYGLLDTYGHERNSERVRRVVGYIMSGGAFSLLTDELKKPYIQCKNSEPWPFGAGGVYFMQDSKTNVPKITAYSDSLGLSRLLAFNHTIITSDDMNTDTNVEEFFKDLNTGNHELKIQGTPDSIEYLSQLRFQIRSGVGTYIQDKLTGAGDLYAPMESMKCELIK
jgi:hypothetical protein